MDSFGIGYAHWIAVDVFSYLYLILFPLGFKFMICRTATTKPHRDNLSLISILFISMEVQGI